MSERVYEFEMSEFQQLKKAVAYDPYVDKSITPEQLAEIKNSKFGNVILARLNCMIKEGLNMGMDRERCYLYIKTEDEFLTKIEERLRSEFKTVKRATAETEAQVIKRINDEESSSNYGVGQIFG